MVIRSQACSTELEGSETTGEVNKIFIKALLITRFSAQHPKRVRFWMMK